MIAGFFEVPASLLAWFYGHTGSYGVAIALIAVVVMALITPLTLKSTKGMLEMQRLGPEMRRLQSEHRGDRQKLNEEMMKLYQEHKVNPMASCLPLVAQMPVFIIMFRILVGLTYKPGGANDVIARAVLFAGDERPGEVGFLPRYLSRDSELFQSLARRGEMKSFGIDLSLSPANAMSDGFGKGLVYVGLVVVLAGLYFLQQRMVAARAALSPTMSPTQQKVMQYLPVFFAIFQIFFLAGLIVYYMAQAILRILQQLYITRRFYGHDEALGRQAQRASERARELAKADGGGSGMFAQMRRPATETTATETTATARPTKSGRTAKSSKPAKSAKSSPSAQAAESGPSRQSKRYTPPKGRPTPSAKSSNGRPRSASSRPGGKKRR